MPHLVPHFRSHLHDEAGTSAFGAALARTLTPGLHINLTGELGAGKTALTRALLHASGHIGHVRSPTYTLAEPYQIALDGVACAVMHFDLYRMTNPEELIEAGLRDYFGAQTICIVEWPEQGQGILPEPDLSITLELEGAGRKVELRAHSTKGAACLARLQFAPNL